jgi:hypothetical protein
VRQRYADTFWNEAALQALAGIYELDVKSPNDAEAARKELLTLPIDDLVRLRLLERARVDAVRKRENEAAAALTTEIEQLRKRLESEKQWVLKRLTGF